MVLTWLLTLTKTHKIPFLGIGHDGLVASTSHPFGNQVALGIRVDRVNVASLFVVVQTNVMADFMPDNVEALCTEPRQLMSCSHGQELGQLADLASDWLFTLVQPMRSQLACWPNFWQWLQLINFHPWKVGGFSGAAAVVAVGFLSGTVLNSEPSTSSPAALLGSNSPVKPALSIPSSSSTINPPVFSLIIVPSSLSSIDGSWSFVGAFSVDAVSWSSVCEFSAKSVSGFVVVSVFGDFSSLLPGPEKKYKF